MPFLTINTMIDMIEALAVASACVAIAIAVAVKIALIYCVDRRSGEP